MIIQISIIKKKRNKKKLAFISVLHVYQCLQNKGLINNK